MDRWMEKTDGVITPPPPTHTQKFDLSTLGRFIIKVYSEVIIMREIDSR